MSMNKYKKGSLKQIQKNKSSREILTDWLFDYEPMAIDDNDIYAHVFKSIDKKIEKYNLKEGLKSNIKMCGICGENFSDKPFENMNGAGEPTVAKIELYDNKYICCPKCSKELYDWVNKKWMLQKGYLE